MECKSIQGSVECVRCPMECKGEQGCARECKSLQRSEAFKVVRGSIRGMIECKSVQGCGKVCKNG